MRRLPAHLSLSTNPDHVDLLFDATTKFTYRSKHFEQVHVINDFHWDKTRTVLERNMSLLAKNPETGDAFLELARGTWKISESEQLILDQIWHVHSIIEGKLTDERTRWVCTYMGTLAPPP